MAAAPVTICPPVVTCELAIDILVFDPEVFKRLLRYTSSSGEIDILVFNSKELIYFWFNNNGRWAVVGH